MTDGHVRPARPEDRPRLRAIQTVVLAEPWSELLETGIEGPPVCLVYADPDPTGYALAVVDGVVAYLAELAVAAGHRSRGQGSALLDALVGRLRTDGVDWLRVTVRETDERARSFYADRGFAVVERLPDHYDAGDGLALERPL
jgi:ribosomal-protein-alanine N-acetyltransferase